MKEWTTYMATTEQIAQHWPHIAKMLDRVPQTIPNHTIESLQELAMEQCIQVWFTADDKIRFVTFSQICNYPKVRVLEFFWGAGEGVLDSHNHQAAIYEAFARTIGCDRVDVIGRPGWEPFMKAQGLHKMAVTFSRMVTPTRRH